MSIQSKEIVRAHGPFNSEEWLNISFFRDSLLSHLDDNERVETDHGFIGEAPDHSKGPNSLFNPAETRFMQQR